MNTNITSQDYDTDILNAHDDSHMTKRQMDEALRDMALMGAMRDAAEGIRRDPSMLTKELVEAMLYAQAMNKMAIEAEHERWDKEDIWPCGEHHIDCECAMCTGERVSPLQAQLHELDW